MRMASVLPHFMRLSGHPAGLIRAQLRDISTVGVAEVNLCFYCTALTRIHTIHTVRAEGSLVRSDSGLELVQALLPAGRLQAADRRLI